MAKLSELLMTPTTEVSPEQRAGLRASAIQADAAKNPFLSTLVGTALGSIGGGTSTALGNIAGAVGLRKVSDSLYETGEELRQAGAPYMAPQLDYRSVDGVGGAWDFVKANAAQGIASMAPIAVASKFGGMPAGVAAGVIPQHGENVLRIKDDAALSGMSEGEILASAAPASAVQGALDYLVPSGVAGKIAGRYTKNALPKAAATMGAAMGIEGTTELAQEEIGMGLHGILNPNRDDSGDTHSRIQSFLGGAVGGAPFGALDAASGYLKDKVENTPQKPLNISEQSDAILNSREKIHPNMTDDEVAETLNRRDAQDSAAAEELAQRIKAESKSPRSQKLADDFLAGDRSRPEEFVKEAKNVDTTEAWVEKAHAAGAKLREKLKERLGTAYTDENGDAHQTPTYLSKEFRELEYTSKHAAADEGMVFDKAGDVVFQKPAGTKSTKERGYAEGQISPLSEPFPERKERVLSELILDSRSKDAAERLKAKAKALTALDGPDGPITRWFEFDFGMRMNNGEPIVPKEMLELSPDLAGLVAEMGLQRAMSGQRVPPADVLQKVFEKIGEMQSKPLDKGELEALFEKFNQTRDDTEDVVQGDARGEMSLDSDEVVDDEVSLFDEIGTDALDPNTFGLGGSKSYVARADSKHIPFRLEDKALMDKRAAELRGSGIESKEVGAWQRLKDAYPDDGVKLYKKEDQLLQTYGAEAWGKLQSLDPNSKEYSTQRRLALETMDREFKYLETQEGEAAEQGEVSGSEFRVTTPSSPGNRWGIQTDGGGGKWFGGPQHGAVWFKRSSDGNEFATSVTKLIKLGRRAQNLSGNKGLVEQKEALLAGISSLLNSKETDGSAALSGFGFKRDPKGKVEWSTGKNAKIPLDLKLHDGNLKEAAIFTPQAQGAFDKYNRTKAKLEKLEALQTPTDKQREELIRAREELIVQEKELRTGKIISTKAYGLIERAKREGYESVVGSIEQALGDMEAAVKDRGDVDNARVILQQRMNELNDFLSRMGFDQDAKEPASDIQMMGAKGVSRSLTEDFANPNKGVAVRDSSGEVAHKAPSGSLAFSKMSPAEKTKYIKAGSVAEIRELLKKYEDEKDSDFYKALINEAEKRLMKEHSEANHPTTYEGELKWFAEKLRDFGVEAMVSLVNNQSQKKYAEAYRLLKRMAGLDKDDPTWGSEAWKNKGLDRTAASKAALEVVNQLDKPSERRLGNAQRAEVDTSVLDNMIVNEDYKLLTTAKRVVAFFEKAADRFVDMKRAQKEADARWERGEDDTEMSAKDTELYGALTNLFSSQLSSQDTVDYESWFDGVDHTEADIARVKSIFASTRKLFNSQSPDPSKEMTEEEKAEIKRYVESVLGPMAVEFMPEIFGKVNGKKTKFSGDWGPGSIRIVVNSLNGMGVAAHEAMHEFFYRMDQDPAMKPMMDKLLKVANSAPVVSQLERLLQGQTGALKQIHPSYSEYQNERLAYMFQFWKAGELSIGPETKNIFQKIADFLRRVTQLLSDDQQAVRIFQAFNEGSFADATTMGAVGEALMKDMNAKKETLDRFTKVAKGPMDKLKQFVYTSHTTLRESGLPAFEELAGMFHTQAGERVRNEHKQSMFDARQQQTGVWMNKLNNILNKYEKVDIEQVLEYLQREDGVAPKDMKQNQLYRDLRKLLDDHFAYVQEAGVMRLEPTEDGKKAWQKIPYRKNYFPVVWDIGSREGDFAADLVKYHEAEIKKRLAEVGSQQSPEEYAQFVVQRLTSSNGAPELDESGSELGFSPLMTSINERTLDWITHPEMTKYRDKNLVSTMTSSIMQGVKRAEYVRMFDNGGAKIRSLMLDGYGQILNKLATERGIDGDKVEKYLTGRYKAILKGETPISAERDLGMSSEDMATLEQDALKEVKKYQDAVMAMEGTIGHDIKPELRKISGALMVYANFRYLVMTLFASMTDPLGILVAGGDVDDAFSAFKEGINGIRKTYGGKIPKSDAESLAELLGTVDAGSALEALGQTYSSVFMNGKTKWLNDQLFKWNGMEAWNRGMRISATQAAIKFFEKHLAKPDKHSTRYLDDLFGGSFRPELVDGKLDTSDPRVKKAIMRWVNSAILSPNAAQRPVWASDPHYAVFFHMKQFTYSFHQTILKRAWNEALTHGNSGPLLTVMAAYTPIAIAASAAKYMLVNQEEPYWMKRGVGATIAHGAMAANMFGVPQIGMSALDASDREEGFVGGSLEAAASVAGPTAGWMKDWYDKPLGDQVIASLPGGNVFTQLTKEDAKEGSK